MIDTIMELMPQVIEGLMVTLKIFILTLIFSIPLGIIAALGRTSKIKVIEKITGLYVLIMRGTPLLLQIVFIFYGLPLMGITIENRTIAALIAFVLNYGAYFAEIFRGGILSIDRGQYEGAEVLGLSSKDTFMRIILPQAIKNILPPAGNEIITLALEAYKVSGLRFCSVDVIRTNDGKIMIMEINSGVMISNYVNLVTNGYNKAYKVYKDAIEAMFKG